MADYNSRYRDSVFRSYFNEPVRLLSLCNAVLATQYTNSDELNINILEGIFLRQAEERHLLHHRQSLLGFG